jgi:hypothetical protein
VVFAYGLLVVLIIKAALVSYAKNKVPLIAYKAENLSQKYFLFLKSNKNITLIDYSIFSYKTNFYFLSLTETKFAYFFYLSSCYLFWITK